MTRKEWTQFYRTLRAWARRQGSIHSFVGDFQWALNACMDDDRQYVLWADGRLTQIWYEALSLYLMAPWRKGGNFYISKRRKYHTTMLRLWRYAARQAQKEEMDEQQHQES